MRWRRPNYKKWDEIRQELPSVIRKIEEGWTYWFDLPQSFDDKHDYALVLGYTDSFSETGDLELAIMLARESTIAGSHDYGWDWELPLIEEDKGDCWDTELRIYKTDADNPEYLDYLVDYYKKEWNEMVEHFEKYKSFEEIRKELAGALSTVNEFHEETVVFPLYQNFDSDKEYAIVVGYSGNPRLGVKIACRPVGSEKNRYKDWQFGVIGPNRTGCGGTEWALGIEDTVPETLDKVINSLQERWETLQPFFKNALYKPEPIDTSNVSLPEELEDLVETLAESNHNNWAIGRFKDGWAWGPNRDDKVKWHPCLIPYDELTTEEQEYDRITSMETLKAIVALGYKITKEE